MIKMSKKSEYVRLLEETKLLFLIYADFESILVPEGNGKQNRDESYTNKYQKHFACSYCYKLVYADDKFSKPFKSCLGKDAVYNFINSMVEENKYCSDLMKKHFNRELVMTKNDKDFENFTKFWICDNVYVEGDFKIHCHLTGNYRGCAHGDCNTKVKSNNKIPVIFHKLKNYNPHLIMQELDNFNFKINIIPNGLEKYMRALTSIIS